MNPKDLFLSYFPEFENHFETLDKLARLVEAKSAEVNITSIRDYESIWSKHIIDSLIPTRSDVFDIAEGVEILDVGTGGGFPGLPLAIIYPEVHFTLLDSTNKKLEIVNEFANELSVKNIKTEWGRAEDHKKTYDYVFSRAVAYVDKLVDLTDPLVHSGGKIVLYKIYSEDELNDAELAAVDHGLDLLDVYYYSLDPRINEEGEGFDRMILVFKR